MPLALLASQAEKIAQNWDDTARICELHGDRTASAAFHTCANQLRRYLELPERDAWLEAFKKNESL